MDSIVFTGEIALELKDKLKNIPAENVYVLVDFNSRQYGFEQLGLKEISEKHIIEIPAGETSKSLEQAATIWESLSLLGAHRNSLLINFGGGVITDLGGFVASCFKRGIRFWNIPTTLLAQVDASVGGKTGINFNGLKNEVGSFASPEWVFIDPYFLSFLPERQWWSGYAEMLKHALLDNKEHLTEITKMSKELTGSTHLLSIIRKSVKVKAAIVTTDPLEKGIRKALNLGHTAGHAVEEWALQRHIECYHGEAVACGLLVSLYLSVKKWNFDKNLYEQLKRFINRHFPVSTFITDHEKLYELMLHDKKNEQPGVNFTLLRSPGVVEINQYCTREEILEALSQIS